MLQKPTLMQHIHKKQMVFFDFCRLYKKRLPEVFGNLLKIEDTPIKLQPNSNQKQGTNIWTAQKVLFIIFNIVGGD